MYGVAIPYYIYLDIEGRYAWTRLPRFWGILLLFTYQKFGDGCFHGLNVRFRQLLALSCGASIHLDAGVDHPIVRACLQGIGHKIITKAHSAGTSGIRTPTTKNKAWQELWVESHSPPEVPGSFSHQRFVVTKKDRGETWAGLKIWQWGGEGGMCCVRLRCCCDALLLGVAQNSVFEAKMWYGNKLVQGHIRALNTSLYKQWIHVLLWLSRSPWSIDRLRVN